MSFQNICAPAPVVSVVNNTVTALSTDVAKLFSKLHKDVLRSIRSLIEQAPSLNERNFALVEVKDAKGENRPAYRMDRKGFVLLAMGFTGEVALKFKIAYIDTFDRMEEQLRRHNQCPALDRLETLTPLQQEAIREEVSKRALRSAADYQTIYKALRLRFQVTRFDLIPRTKFETALKFIQEVELKAPVARIPDAYLFSYDPKTLSDDELESLARLIYLLDLAKPTNKQVYAGLRAVYSDLSPRFYSLMTETAISESNLKKVLDRNRINYRLPSPN
jgi:Rha family phage regulatory protein